MTKQEQPPRNHFKVVMVSIGTVIGMLLFVYYGLRPMYFLICEWTGITGSSFDQAEAQPFVVQEDRPIKVQFLALNNAAMSWQFRAVDSEVIAYPGEVVQVSYYARNASQRDMVGQAVPSLSPYEATSYFSKTECFCFNQQPLAAGEEAELGLVFQIDPDLPDWVKTISLTYTLFDVTGELEVSLLD